MKKILATMAFTLIPMAVFAQSSVPSLVPVQGLLTDTSGVRIDGQVDVTFRIYDAETSGNTLFDETQTLDVTDGLFTAYLGVVTSLDLNIFGTDLWLGVTVAGDPEMPRYYLGTAPHAAFAHACGDAETLGGMVAGDFAEIGHTHAFADLTDIPAGLDDGDDDTTYVGGTGIAIGGNTITTDDTHIENVAKNVCYDVESELTTALDDNYAASGHDHNGVYSAANHNHNTLYSTISHNHSGVYAALNHTHTLPTFACTNAMTTVTHTSNSGGQITATCPSGYIVTGGGHNVGVGVSVLEQHISRSYPSGNAWSVFHYNSDSNSDADITVYARCCRLQ